ncbi:hypothetical protein BH10ACI2_BH10ACI2_01860 [soil metagenome]
MKKDIDFGSGIRGKHAGIDLKVLGSSKSVWAVCVTKESTDLIPFKMYKIEVFSESEEIRSINEKGEKVYYPKAWFAPVEVSKQTLGLLEHAF